MSRVFKYFCLGSRGETLPFQADDTCYVLDASALRVLMTPDELRDSPSGQEFLENFRALEGRGRRLDFKGALLEWRMNDLAETLPRVYSDYVRFSEFIFDAPTKAETYSQFLEQAAVVMVRYSALAAMVTEASKCYQEFPTANCETAALARMRRFSEWADVARKMGTRTPMARPLFAALCLNNRARAAFGIRQSWKPRNVFNGAWDLLQWETAYLHLTDEQGPAVVFVTADADLSVVLKGRAPSTAPGPNPDYGMDLARVCEVMGQTSDRMPLLKVHEYAAYFARVAADTKALEARTGADKYTTGFCGRFQEFAEALRAYSSFELYDSSGLA